ncbi:MAG: PF20097 family protein [Candidatus Thorarchaeota archaeon]
MEEESAKPEICPSCGEPMEQGFLVAPRRIFWCDHAPELDCICGERLSRPWIICANVPGHRCKKCKLILYQEPRQPPKKDTSDWPAG